MEFNPLLRRFALAPLPIPASWYAVPLRLIVGFGFVEHGYAKLSRGADGFIAILHAIGVPFADLLGWATIIVEIVGGLLILAGALVPVATVPMIVVLLVAIFTVHLPNGFSSIKLMSYDAAGAPTWYVMPGGAWTNDTRFEGDLYATTGSDWRVHDFTPGTVTKVGRLSMTFTSNTAGTLEYTITDATGPHNISKAMQKQQF